MNEYTLLYYKFHCIEDMETKGIKVIGKLLDHCFMQTGYVNMRVDRGGGAWTMNCIIFTPPLTHKYYMPNLVVFGSVVPKKKLKSERPRLPKITIL